VRRVICAGVERRPLSFLPYLRMRRLQSYWAVMEYTLTLTRATLPKLDEQRSYLYANRESVRGYAEAYRNGERISTAHVECNVNQLINWRMCKKQQMG